MYMILSWTLQNALGREGLDRWLIVHTVCHFYVDCFIHYCNPRTKRLIWNRPSTVGLELTRQSHGSVSSMEQPYPFSPPRVWITHVTHKQATGWLIPRFTTHLDHSYERPMSKAERVQIHQQTPEKTLLKAGAETV